MNPMFDPVTVAAELAAGRLVAGLESRLRRSLRRRDMRRQLADDAWQALVSAHPEVLRREQGSFDPDALWEWTQEPEVQASLMSADSEAVCDAAPSIAKAWRSRSYDEQSPLTGEIERHAARVVHGLFVLDALAGDDLLSVLNARTRDEIKNLHNDLALVCATVVDAADEVRTAARNLSRWSDHSLELAAEGIVANDGRTIVVERNDVLQAVATAVAECPDDVALVVTGVPDTGKSHLVMRVAEQSRLRQDVAVVDLRNMPGSLLDIEAALGGSFGSALTALATARTGLFVIDGAERAQIDGPELLVELLRTAKTLGLKAIIVSRDDAFGDIEAALARAGIPVRRHQMSGLSDAEVATLSQDVDPLRDLTSTPAGAWMARRPGLLKAWLTLAPGRKIRNEGHLIELLRAQSIAKPGPDRSARIELSNRLARAELGEPPVVGTPDGLDALRSAGVLSPATNTWDVRISFSDDLWRDTALAGLIASDFEGLSGYPNIRPAIRAAVVACELALNEDPQRFAGLRAIFDGLSEHTRHRRWSEVPFEALASLGGDAESWETVLDVVAADGDSLDRLLAVARRASNSLLLSAPQAMSDFISVLLRRCSDSAQLRELLRAWLGAYAIRGSADPDSARAEVCGWLIQRPPSSWRDQDRKRWLADMALCGADLSDGAKAAIDASLADDPTMLDEVFRDLRVGYGLARSDPSYLLALCEQYYIVGDGWSHEALRSPSFEFLFSDRVHARRTPFFWLRQVVPSEALASAHRILTAACESSRRSVGLPEWDADDEAQEPTTLTLDLPGRGPVELSGEESTWNWYRNTMNGGETATNMLLAVEQYADSLLDRGLSVDVVTNLLLSQAPSVPMVGLVVGMSIRHLDPSKPSEALMCWLGQPIIWHLESARSTSELTSFGHVGDNEVAGADLRRRSLRDVASSLALAALLNSDEELQQRVETVADELAERAGGDDVVVQMWASEMRPSAMTIRETENGLEVSVDTPEEVLAAVDALHSDIRPDREPDAIAGRYEVRFGTPGDTPTDTNQLSADLDRCMSCTDDEGSPSWQAARTNVAAAVVRAAAADALQLTPEARLWATEAVLRTVETDREEEDLSFTVWSPVVSVASALPILLRWELESVGPHKSPLRDRLVAAVERLASRAGTEVVWRLLACGEESWLSPCNNGSPDECPAVIAGRLAGLVLDRAVGPYRPRHDDEEEAGAIRWIDPALVLAALALSAGADADQCEHSDFATLRDTALRLHSEAFAGGIGNQPHTDGNHFARVGASLLAMCVRHSADKVAEYVLSLPPTQQYEALSGIRQAAGEDPEKRPDLAARWPNLMRTLSGRLPHEDRLTDPHAELIPVVRTDPYSFSSGEAFNEASANWIDPRSIDGVLPRWASSAAGCGKCARALGAFLLSSDVDWIESTGLPTLRVLVESCSSESLAAGGAPWLEDLANDSLRSATLNSNPDLLAILDCYVDADDGHAIVARQRWE
jgi:hypothetical protein